MRFYKILFLSLLLTACGGSGGSGSRCNVIGLDARVLEGEPCTDTDSAVVSVGVTFGEDVPDNCSGVMITPNQVLTAGHCIPNDPSAVAIYVSGRAVRAETIRIHPLYRFMDNGAISYDLGIIDLANPAGVASLPLLKSTTAQVGDELSFFGYGSDENARSGILRVGPVRVNAVDAESISTLYTDGTANPCNGDAGGPLVKEITNDAGQKLTTVAGILSIGTTQNCAVGDNPRYINLQDPAVVSWISQFAPAALYR